jgi:hypothetical protein
MMKKLWSLLATVVLVASCAGANSESGGGGNGQVQQALVTCPTPAQLDTDLTAASQGDVLNLSGVDPLACPEIPMTQTWAGGSLIFSDSPETVPTRGKLYEDSFPATSGTTYNRMWVYHVNGKASGKMKLAILIKNTGTSTGTLTIQKKGLAGPSTSFVTVGKLAFQRWEQSTAGTGVSVAAGATVRLDSANFEQLFNPGYLMHGIYDISMTQSYKTTICALDQNDNPLTVCPGLSVLARDVHDRGTFPNADKIYDTQAGFAIDTIDGIQQFPLNSDSASDPAAVGVDATDGTPMTLHGNIGVLYRIHLLNASSDGQNVGFILNPRGGYWGSAVYAMPGLLPGGVFLTPAASEGFSDNTKACVEGRYTPGGGLTTWLQWMMTGGSNAPVRVLAVPH